ncbi:MAG: patatin-like phospholipase family protein [Burkholderiales bacterium]
MTVDKGKSVSLVLGSGGARGFAHIGVIHWLEENGYRIESVSGCSMGALIGGAYAAGKLDEYEQWVRSVSRADIFRMLDLSWGGNGFFKGERLMHALKDFVGDRLIEDLPIAYTAVAADVTAEKEIWLRSGKLADAIRASISMPLFFTAFKHHGAELVDGGVLNPVPVAPTLNDKTDITVAVNLVGPPLQDREQAEAAPAEPEDESSILPEGMNRLIDSVKEMVSRPIIRDWGVYTVANSTLDAMQSTIARHRLADYRPDYLIEIARNACGTLEFARASEMIEFGYEKARDCLGANGQKP